MGDRKSGQHEKENIPYSLDIQTNSSSLTPPFRINHFKILDGSNNNNQQAQERLRKQNQVLASLDSQGINQLQYQGDKPNLSSIQQGGAQRNRKEKTTTANSIAKEEEKGKQSSGNQFISRKQSRLSSLQTSQEANLAAVIHSENTREFNKAANYYQNSTEPSSQRVSDMAIKKRQEVPFIGGEDQNKAALNQQENWIVDDFKKQEENKKQLLDDTIIYEKKNKMVNSRETNNSSDVPNCQLINASSNLSLDKNLIVDSNSGRITFYPKQSQQKQQEQDDYQQIQHDQLPQKKQLNAQIRLPSEPIQILGALKTNPRPQSLPPFSRVLKIAQPKVSQPSVPPQNLHFQGNSLENERQQKMELIENKQEGTNSNSRISKPTQGEKLKYQPSQGEELTVGQVNTMKLQNIFEKNQPAENVLGFEDRKRSVNYSEFDRLGILQTKQIQGNLSQNASTGVRRKTATTPIQKCSSKKQHDGQQFDSSLVSDCYDATKDELSLNKNKKTDKSKTKTELESEQQLYISVEQISKDQAVTKADPLWNYFSESKQTRGENGLRKRQHTTDSMVSPEFYGKKMVIQTQSGNRMTHHNSSSLDASFSQNKDKKESIERADKIGDNNSNNNSKIIILNSQHSSINPDFKNSSNRQTFSAVEEYKKVEDLQFQGQKQFNLPSLTDSCQPKRKAKQSNIIQQPQILQQPKHFKGSIKQPHLSERAQSLQSQGKVSKNYMNIGQFKQGQQQVAIYSTLNNSPVVKMKTLPQQASEKIEIPEMKNNLTEIDEDSRILEETGRFGQENSQQMVKQQGSSGMLGADSCIGKEWIVPLENIFQQNQIKQDILFKQNHHLHSNLFIKATHKQDKPMVKVVSNNKQDTNYVTMRMNKQQLPNSIQNNIQENNSNGQNQQFNNMVKQSTGGTSSIHQGNNTKDNGNISLFSRNNNILADQKTPMIEFGMQGVNPTGIAQGRLVTHSTKAASNPFPDPRLGTLLIHYNFPNLENSLNNNNNNNSISQQQQQQQQFQTSLASVAHKKVSSAAACSRKYDFYHNYSPCNQLQNPLNIEVQPNIVQPGSQQRARSSNNRFPREIFTPNVQKAKRLNSLNPSTLHGQTYQFNDWNEFL